MAKGVAQSPGGFQTKPGIRSKLGGGQKNHSSWFQLEGLAGPKTSKQSHTTFLAVSTGQLEIQYNNPITWLTEFTSSQSVSQLGRGLSPHSLWIRLHFFYLCTGMSLYPHVYCCPKAWSFYCGQLMCYTMATKCHIWLQRVLTQFNKIKG